MAFTVIPTEQEIDEQINKTYEQEDSGSRYPGMSYEEGVRAMYDWLITGEDPPFED